MDYQKLPILIAFAIATIFLFIFRLLNQIKNSRKLPPGPKPFPIIGNILELGKNPHKSLTKLSKIYGPIMTLKLGKITTIVISSPQVAKQVIQENSQIFSSRTIPHSACVLDHRKFAVGWLPVAPKWKKLRRVCATKVFAPRMLDSTKEVRLQKLQELVDYVNEKCNKGEVLDIGKVIFTTVLNSISNILFSMDLARSELDEKSQEFEKSIRGLSEDSGRPNVSDFFPVLRVLDPQRVLARMAIHWKKISEVVGGIIEERMHSRISGGDSVVLFNDVLDSVLNGTGDTESQLNREEVFHLFLDLFIAGIDTTSNTVEWIMAELLRNPDKLTKAKKELSQEIGKNERIEESQVSKLPYLQAIVKETLRLHPPAPLLVPRKCDKTVNISGYIVPRNAQVLINVWAMGRDSTIWENPNDFIPERFLDCEINYKGNNFEFIPFGGGPRICPGLPLAQKTVPSMVASLVHNFDWKLADGLLPEEINMEEKFGLTLTMVQPLRVQPISVNHG